MAWEDRNGRRYYYRKRREGGRVVSEYVGNGFIGDLASARDGEERFKADIARADWLKQKESAEAIDEQISEAEKYTKAIVKAVLLISGYHMHKRQWRKARQ